MASVLRPTTETGRIAATKQPASAIGPSWTKRAGREARLAMRQAQKRGDREGAMRIAMDAEEAGLPAQASIGSAERRMAGDVVNREKDTAITAEIGQALTPPAVSEQPALIKKYGNPEQSPAIPPAPGASEPPENPVSGATSAATGDADARLADATHRRWTPASQGLAGRRALSNNLRKSIEAGGGSISGDRLKRAKAEADRLGITPEQFLGEIQDIGGSMPQSDLKSVLPKDNRSLDQRLRGYQDKYLGGGATSELPARLRADSETNRTAAEAMRRARQSPAAPATPATPAASAPRQTAPTPTPPVAPRQMTAAPSRSSLLGGSPTTPPAPRNVFDAPVFRTSLTTPEARAARLKEEGKARQLAERDRRLKAQADIDARIEDRVRNIRVPDWQQGTYLGEINRRWQEFSARAQR